MLLRDPFLNNIYTSRLFEALLLEFTFCQSPLTCANVWKLLWTVYGKERLCVFDGYYYCYECHENSEHYIPAYIVFNWDFRPYQGFSKCFCCLLL